MDPVAVNPTYRSVLFFLVAKSWLIIVAQGLQLLIRKRWNVFQVYRLFHPVQVGILAWRKISQKRNVFPTLGQRQPSTSHSAVVCGIPFWPSSWTSRAASSSTSCSLCLDSSSFLRSVVITSFFRRPRCYFARKLNSESLEIDADKSIVQTQWLCLCQHKFPWALYRMVGFKIIWIWKTNLKFCYVPPLIRTPVDSKRFPYGRICNIIGLAFCCTAFCC